MPERQFWAISPNVKGTNRTVDAWKTEIINGQVAIMGWPPDNPKHRHGLRFAGNHESSIKHGDIVLIIRRHQNELDMVGFGIVDGEYRKVRLPPSNDDVCTRKLRSFVPLNQAPDGIPFFSLVKKHRSALQQLKPETNSHHKMVCDWMERELKPGRRKRRSDKDQSGSVTVESVDITERELKKSKFGYKVTSQSRVTTARNIESDLVWEYKCWLEKRGRNLNRLNFNQLECDCWEEEAKNLIEAKSSTRREDIRMAVGQLFDYSYQLKKEYKNPHLAILLPKKPSPDVVNWLPVGINVIWRKNRSFFDNADGQFTKSNT